MILRKRNQKRRVLEQKMQKSKTVLSYNEWDPLEEVILGVIDGAAVPEWHLTLEATAPKDKHAYFRRRGGKSFPKSYVEAAQNELDMLASILTNAGVIVKRPEKIDHKTSFNTPSWRAKGGLYSMMPRDILMVVGDTIIEALMAWRSRYFEFKAYRPLLKSYFLKGAKWLAGPKPELVDELYDKDFDREAPGSSNRYVVTEFEPVFDTADFIRCGKDIFVQKSHVTNQMGIDWLARHIGDDYQVHVIEIADSSPMHIDASFMPLAPGKLLIHPARVKKIPKQFSNWEVRHAPSPELPSSHLMYLSSSWVSMNVLMLNPTTVIVEKQELSLMKLLEDWGFNIIPCDFRNVMRFGGAFHCVTCDIRRRGILQSYF